MRAVARQVEHDRDVGGDQRDVKREVHRPCARSTNSDGPTEIGRQPWLVSGILTAADAASKVTAPRIALTLSAYLTLYVALIVAYISVVFYLARHRTHADQPFGDDLAQQPNVMNYPEKEASKGAAHA